MLVAVKSALASDNVKVTTAVCPAARVVWSEVMATVGGTLSGPVVLVVMVTMLVVVGLVSAPSALKLPAASLNLVLATLTVLLTVLLALGVKVAV